ncbi:MAG: hypothetical protein Ta2B_17540 [Termitinemataceae bacterium]|nr:MAG: hypothetical protein Ta2B_17540 [Termitinemataceae bacterium]
MKIVKLALFVFLFLAVFFAIKPVLKFKHGDGIEPLNEFYKFKGDIDVAFFGSSHVFIGVNPVVLWEEKGIPSYVLGGSIQPLWNTYYYIKECLKYKNPKVVVVDVFCATQDYEYIDYSRVLKNNLGLKPSIDKMKSILVSTPDKKLWIDMICFDGFSTYHTRYNEITKNDFVDPYDNGTVYLNGYGSGWNTQKQETPDVSNVITQRKIPHKQLEYLMKIIELSRTEGFELMFIVVPYTISESDQEIYNAVNTLAQEESINFINYNLLYDKISFDFSSDMLDPWHINYSGGQKITVNLANELFTTYGLIDRRHDPNYGEWNNWTLTARNRINTQK